jgi:hypothetical protein
VFKPVTLRDSLTVYSLEDRAIDWDAMVEADEKKRPKVQLKKELMGEAMLRPSILRDRVKVKSGEQLCRFGAGVIPSDALTRINDERHAVGVFWWMCFLSGLRSLDWPDKPETHLIDGVEYIKPEWLKQVFVGPLHKVGEEIGMYILAFNRVEENEVSL